MRRFAPWLAVLALLAPVTPRSGAEARDPERTPPRDYEVAAPEVSRAAWGRIEGTCRFAHPVVARSAWFG